jgi:hypothetical protein
MASPFVPLGEKPLWHSIYDHARELPYGALVSYQKLDNLLERDSRSNRSAIYSAIKHLELNEKRTMMCIPKQGYKVAEPPEHLTLARKRRTRARRQVAMGIRTISATAREQLDSEQARRLDEFELYLGRVDQTLRGTIRRVEVVEKAQAEQAQDFGEQLAELRAAMKTAGIEIKEQ